MKVYFAADHAGFEIKNALVERARALGYDAIDCGARSFDQADDYPPIIAEAARLLSADAAAGLDSRAIIAGASGQGEAMVANRFPRVRCALYYGDPGRSQTDAGGKTLDLLASTREHNDANALSLGLRFLSREEAGEAMERWLAAPFPGEERHFRRVRMIEAYPQG